MSKQERVGREHRVTVNVSPDAYERLSGVCYFRSGRLSLVEAACRVLMEAGRRLQDGLPTKATDPVSPVPAAIVKALGGRGGKRKKPRRYTLSLHRGAHQAASELARHIEMVERKGPVTIGEAVGRAIAAALESSYAAWKDRDEDEDYDYGDGDDVEEPVDDSMPAVDEGEDVDVDAAPFRAVEPEPSPPEDDIDALFKKYIEAHQQLQARIAASRQRDQLVRDSQSASGRPSGGTEGGVVASHTLVADNVD